MATLYSCKIIAPLSAQVTMQDTMQAAMQAAMQDDQVQKSDRDSVPDGCSLRLGLLFQEMVSYRGEGATPQPGRPHD